ncbi:MAG TPA: hypothetical protein DDY18_05055 [Flavobacterium sp.]|jgi:heterodisulfide reductase subunit B|nr:hypothetical protein [Flavobacterium sp.]
MSDVKKLIENFANSVYIEHEDHTKCGQCWKEKIKSEVANEFLKAGKLDQNNLKEMFEEIDKRWQQTALYLRVKEMLSSGMKLEKIREILELEGIEI